jgi:hypothetical protein
LLKQHAANEPKYFLFACFVRRLKVINYLALENQTGSLA